MYCVTRIQLLASRLSHTQGALISPNILLCVSPLLNSLQDHPRSYLSRSRKVAYNFTCTTMYLGSYAHNRLTMIHACSFSSPLCGQQFNRASRTVLFGVSGHFRGAVLCSNISSAKQSPLVIIIICFILLHCAKRKIVVGRRQRLIATYSQQHACSAAIQTTHALYLLLSREKKL